MEQPRGTRGRRGLGHGWDRRDAPGRRRAACGRRRQRERRRAPAGEEGEGERGRSQPRTGQGRGRPQGGDFPLNWGGDTSQTPANCGELGLSLPKPVQPLSSLISGTDKTIVEILQRHDQDVTPPVPLGLQNREMNTKC